MSCKCISLSSHDKDKDTRYVPTLEEMKSVDKCHLARTVLPLKLGYHNIMCICSMFESSISRTHNDICNICLLCCIGNRCFAASWKFVDVQDNIIVNSRYIVGNIVVLFK